MTLYNYMKRHNGIDELTIWDKEYDIESYWYPDYVNPVDKWDQAMKIISKKLEIIEEKYGRGVVVNLSDVIERNINNGVFKNLFIRNNVDSIMYDIQNVFSGYVSEKWMMDFAKSLK